MPRALVSRQALLVGFVVAVVLACLPATGAGEEEISVDVLKAGCRAALLSVRSGKGPVTVRTRKFADGTTSEFESTCQLAFAGPRYRLSEERVVVRNDTPPGRDPGKMIPVGSKSHREVAVDAETVTVLAGGKATIGSASTRYGLIEASYTQCMLDFSPSRSMATGKGLVDIGAVESTFLGKHYSRVDVVVNGRETIDGNECICVEIVARGSSTSVADRIIRYWVDPRRGFAIPRARAFYQGGPYPELTLSNETNTELREYASGVWYPSKATIEYYRLDRIGKPFKYLEKTIRYASDFQLNLPLQDDVFLISLPPKTSVYDADLDASYSIP